MLFSMLTGCNLPFTILFVAALASLLCSLIINTNTVEAEGITKPSKGTPTFKNYQISSKIISKTLINEKISFDKNIIFDSSICQSDEDSDFCNLFADEDDDDYLKHSILKPAISRHYICPPTSLEALRKRYGTRKSIWGEWTPAQTRSFYKSQLPKALQIDGSLGLTLEERAQLASASRHALRTYARERCHLPGRILALLYDGIRHVHFFGTWSSSGMTWSEVQEKYRLVAKTVLGPEATEDEIAMFVYRTIVDKSCSTNEFFDRMAYSEPIRNMTPEKLLNILAVYTNAAWGSVTDSSSIITQTATSMKPIVSINNTPSGISSNNIIEVFNNINLNTLINTSEIIQKDNSIQQQLKDFHLSTAPPLCDNINEININMEQNHPPLPSPSISTSDDTIEKKTTVLTNNNMDKNILITTAAMTAGITTTCAACMSVIYSVVSNTMDHIPVIPFVFQLFNH